MKININKNSVRYYFIGLMEVKYKLEMTCAEIGAKTEDLEFSVRNGADKLAENAQCQKIMKTGGYVRIIFMRLDLKFQPILTPGRWRIKSNCYPLRLQFGTVFGDQTGSKLKT